MGAITVSGVSRHFWHGVESVAGRVGCVTVMLMVFGCSVPAEAASKPRSPEWTKNLIIYEIAPRGFTSPKGPESGNFTSLK